MSAPFLSDWKVFRDNWKIELPDSGRILTSKSDDIIWNVVLAYLNSFPLSDEKELNRCVKCLTGGQEVNQNIRESIEKCNPFLDCDSYFCDKEISKVVDEFRTRVRDDFENIHEDLFDEPTYFKFLEASSRLLSCNTVLKNGHNSVAFPQHIYSNLRWKFQKPLSIFNEIGPYGNDGFNQGKFSFCIAKDIGLEKKMLALSKILEWTKINSQRVIDLPGITENFLIELLKNDFDREIRLIYESPDVLSKLFDAGFETDPRVRDSEGKSAFFHALKTEKSEIVFLLYDHVANACSQTGIPVNSDDLMCLKEHLQQLGKELKSEEVSEKSRGFLGDLCQFNDFQIDIREKIEKINIKYYELTGKDYEALQRKETILKILTTYEIYFDYINMGLESTADAGDNNQIIFKEFSKHRYYFDKLDFALAVMFFDNLFLLKEILKLPNNAYSEVESNFFLFLIFRKYLEKCEDPKLFPSLFRWIIFHERVSLRKNLSSFKKILEETEPSKDTVNKVTELDVPTLTNLPEIYGEFLTSRLQHYFNAATGLVVGDLKSVLVIERSLQVMGECCRESDSNSVEKILTLCLSKYFTKDLKVMRNSLSHIEIHEVLRRTEIEEDVGLFREIQKELVKLNKLLIPIHSAHKYGLDKFLLMHYENAVRKYQGRNISEVPKNQPKAFLSSLEREEDYMHIPSLQVEIKTLNYKENTVDKNTAIGYKLIVQNMISAIENTLKNLDIAVHEKIEELDGLFYFLEIILTYAFTNQKLANASDRKQLELTQKKRKSIFMKLKENANKSSVSIPQETPVEERDSVRKCLTTMSENNIKQTPNSEDPFMQYGVLLESNNKKGNDTDITNFPHNPVEIVNDTDFAHNPVEIVNDTDFAHNPAERVLNNIVHNEIYLGNSENRYAQNKRNDLSLLDSNDTMEWEDPNFSGNHEAIIQTEESTDRMDWEDDHNPCGNHETIIQTEEKDFIFAKASAFGNECLQPDFYHDYLDNGEVEFSTKISDVKIKSLIKKYLGYYKRISHAVFQNFPGNSDEDFHFKNIEHYCLILKGETFLKEEEKKFILESVPERFRNISEIKQRILRLLQKEVKFTLELDILLSILKLKDQDIRYIKKEIEKYGVIEDTSRIVSSARDYFSDLEKVMESEKLDKKEYELLCEKLELPDNAKSVLSKLIPRSINLERTLGNKLEFLRNRIKMLKSILIDKNDAIRPLWLKGPKGKMRVKEKIVQLYLKDLEIQASVETLLFHCMNISRNQQQKQLWKKSTILFRGINLRNVLAHGNPLLESLGGLLDPCNLPSELVGKMLQLISDEDVLDCMQKILEKSGADLNGFRKIMLDKENEQFRDLRKQISKCDRWKSYAVLIPVESGRNA